MVRDNKVSHNTDWKFLDGDSHLAIHVGSVYTRFREYFKRTNENNLEIPSEKEIKNAAKKRGFNLNNNAYFGAIGGTKRCLKIDLKEYRHLQDVLLERLCNVREYK